MCSSRAPGVHRRVAAIFALGLLAGCQAGPDLSRDVAIGLRNPTAPLGGSSRYDAGRFAGVWKTVRCIGACAGDVRYVVATDGVMLREAGGIQTAYRSSAPGVLREVGGTETLVIMWVDEGFRTAAVGDADGAWAAVLDRRRPGGADRVKAATEILDFNGWDVSKMREVNG